MRSYDPLKTTSHMIIPHVGTRPTLKDKLCQSLLSQSQSQSQSEGPRIRTVSILKQLTSELVTTYEIINQVLSLLFFLVLCSSMVSFYFAFFFFCFCSFDCIVRERKRKPVMRCRFFVYLAVFIFFCFCFSRDVVFVSFLFFVFVLFRDRREK